MLNTSAHEIQETRNWDFIRFCTTVVAIFCLWTVRATLVYDRVDLRLHAGLSRGYVGTLITLVFLLGPIVFMYLGSRTAGWLTTRSFWSTPRHLLLSGIIFSVYFACMLVFFHRASVIGQVLHHRVPLLIALIFVNAAIEECFARGYLLGELQKRVSFGLANVAAAAIFCMLHLPSWLWTHAAKLAIIKDAIGIFILGILLGYLVRKTGSLWTAIIGHTLNNILLLP